MNLFQTIAHKLEEQTSYPVAPFQDIEQSVEVNTIFLLIKKVEKTEHLHKLKVSGELAIKEGCGSGFQILSALLDLELTGTRAEVKVLSSSHKFSTMSMPFSIYVYQNKESATIKEVHFVRINNNNQ